MLGRRVASLFRPIELSRPVKLEFVPWNVDTEFVDLAILLVKRAICHQSCV